MAVLPFANFEDDICEQVITICEPLVNNQFVDEAGNPLAVPMSSVFKLDETLLPQVVVSVALGEQPYGFAQDRLGRDDVDGDPYGFIAKETEVQFDVWARSEPERHHITAALMSGVPSAVVQNDDGTLIENYVRLALRERGIKARYGARPLYPPQAQPNPDGVAVLHGYWTLVVDVSIRWRAGLGPAGDMELSITGLGPTPPAIVAPPISLPAPVVDQS